MILLGALACAMRTSPAPAAMDANAVLPAHSDVVRVVDTEGARELLRASAGRHRFVGFFATWCAPCEAEAHMLQALADEGRAEVLLVSLDLPGDAPAVEAWRRRLKLTVPMVRLESPELLPAAEGLLPGWPRLLPTLLVVAPDGGPVARLDGVVPRAALAPWLR
jgi:thiol-disulfide isomerase/thioredoxin